MKDKQATAPYPAGGVPLVSPLLHYLAMPVLVFLRCQFGYAFLSPKSVFLASIFACGLFSYILWHEPVWRERFGPLVLFLDVAGGLYLLHLATSLIRQARGKAAHDQHSGSSLLLLPLASEKRPRFEAWCHGLIEPLLVIGFSIAIGNGPLGRLVFICGISLFLKESLRAWLDIRRRKRVDDNIEDAGDSVAGVSPKDAPPISAAGRELREILPRKSGDE